MDLQVIGNFIKEQRKNKKITQLELADKIGVSEKTISKWECGNGLPDASLMLPLCRELDITANELLSGKKLTNEEYREQAENNLLLLKSQHEKISRFMLTAEYIFAFVTTFYMLAILATVAYLNIADWLRILIIFLDIIPFAISLHFCMLIEKDVGYYECSNCNYKYIPELKKIYIAPHIGRTRYMECPKCGKKSWQKKVLK